MFEPSTREKANGKPSLLICDGHDSHISAQFIRYSIDSRIIVFLLLPHSSHLLQPLDVGVFSPLKRAMSTQLSRLYATEISRLQKVEWLEHYVQARSKAITSENILGGWRGAGIFPRYPHRVVRQLSDKITSPPPASETAAPTPYLISSSRLWSGNMAFKEALYQANIPSHRLRCPKSP